MTHLGSGDGDIQGRLHRDEGEFVLRSSMDVERLLSGVETRVQVSGEQLSAEATEHGLRFGLNGVYRQGRFSIGAEVAARQELGSTDSEYAGFLNVASPSKPPCCHPRLRWGSRAVVVGRCIWSLHS